MGDAIGAVTVTEHKSMTGRQLPVYRIDVQIHPWTCTGFHVRIISNLGAEATDRNEVIHDIFPPALVRFSTNALDVGHSKAGIARTG
jgi:hypothetical protein